jgi:hypothetical protein
LNSPFKIVSSRSFEFPEAVPIPAPLTPIDSKLPFSKNNRLHFPSAGAPIPGDPEVKRKLPGKAMKVMFEESSHAIAASSAEVIPDSLAR